MGKIRLNENEAVVKTVREGLKRTGGYCPCRLERTEAFKCMCEEFKAQIADPDYEGYCHCFLDAHFFDDLRNELMNGSVRTARAVVHHIVSKNRCLLIDDVLWFLDIFYIHGLSLFQIVELLECIHDLIWSEDVSALSSVESYRTCTVYCKLHIVNHLSEVELDSHHALYLS